MEANSHAHHDKVKVTIECTANERAYIKMLAAKAHLNISELVMSYLRTDFPRLPNKKTLEAHEEAMKGGGVDCNDLDDFWKQMGVQPSVFD